MSNGDGSPNSEAGTSAHEKGTSTAPHRLGGPKRSRVVPPAALDRRQTTSWAIADAGGAAVAVVAWNVFLLVNRETGREHQLRIKAIGPGTKWPSPSAGPVDYTLFTTSRPVSFEDFDGVGVRFTSLNIGVFLGYSIVYLTIWDGPALVSEQLACVKMSGWGAMLPGGSVGMGWGTLVYGSGGRSGTVPLVIAPEPDDYVHEPALASIRLAAMESPRINVPADLLFDFDSSALKPDARRPLLYLADLLNNRKSLPVDLEGHTDSIGDEPYNLDLSERRAKAVKDWFVARRVYRAREFRVLPFGESRPVRPNSKPDGSDDPEARRLNRRVVVRGDWNA